MRASAEQGILDAMESMLGFLQEKQSDLVDVVGAVKRTIATEEEDAGPWRAAFILAQSALFSENGATAEELCAAAGMSEPATAKKRKHIKELGFLRETHKDRQRFYSLALGDDGIVARQMVDCDFGHTDLELRFFRIGGAFELFNSLVDFRKSIKPFAERP